MADNHRQLPEQMDAQMTKHAVGQTIDLDRDQRPAETSAKGAIETVQELSNVLDGTLRAQTAENTHQDFASLVGVLRRIKKVNPHQHMTGSIGGPSLLELVAGIYRRDPEVGNRFLDYVTDMGMLRLAERKGFFMNSDAAIARWMEPRVRLPGKPGEFAASDRHLDMARLAFQSSNVHALELFHEAYRQVALENFADGVGEVWYRTTLGDQDDGQYARAALNGAISAQEETHGRLKVRFLAGTRKLLAASPDTSGDSDSSQGSPFGGALNLLQENADDSGMVLGIDSVGVDADWKPEQQESLRKQAAVGNLWVAVHFAESWPKGGLLDTLERLEQLIRYGVIDHLDNSNALFATPDENSGTKAYAECDWRVITYLQHHIFGLLTKRGIPLGINPTSNDWLTRSLRAKEGWRFRKFDELLGEGLPSVLEMMVCGEETPDRLRIVVGNDNSRIYPSRIEGTHLTVSEELASMWNAPGRAVPGQTNGSVYGVIPTNGISRLVLNGLELADVGRAQTLPLLAESRSVS